MSNPRKSPPLDSTHRCIALRHRNLPCIRRHRTRSQQRSIAIYTARDCRNASPFQHRAPNIRNWRRRLAFPHNIRRSMSARHLHMPPRISGYAHRKPHLPRNTFPHTALDMARMYRPNKPHPRRTPANMNRRYCGKFDRYKAGRFDILNTDPLPRNTFRFCKLAPPYNARMHRFCHSTSPQRKLAPRHNSSRDPLPRNTSPSGILASHRISRRDRRRRNIARYGKHPTHRTSRMRSFYRNKLRRRIPHRLRKFHSPDHRNKSLPQNIPD